MKIKQIIKKSGFSLTYFAFLIVMPLLFTSVFTLYLIAQHVRFTDLDLLSWAAWYMVFAFTMAFALTPTTYIAIISGHFLGWSSLIYVVPTYLMASYIGFYIAKVVDRGNLLKLLASFPTTMSVIDKLRKSDVAFIILSRLSPALPFAVMNYVLSSMNVPVARYLLAGFLGMLPRTLLFIWLGSRAADILHLIQKPTAEGMVQLSFILLLFISFAGILRLITKKAGEHS